MTQATKYAPPTYPPPKTPLLKSLSPSANYQIDLELLAHQGWTSLPIRDSVSDPLYSAFSELFSASAQFFSLPEDERLKYRITPRGDFQQSEEGYSHVPGEKSMITLRKTETTPSEFELRAKAEAAWRASGDVMRDMLIAIEESLGMAPGALVRTADAQLALPQEGAKNVATLMRMFRYERPPATAEPESRIVAESHKDLGLLSLVVGHSPGLECWNAAGECWVSCEDASRGQLNATVLVGQTLAKFTNWRYAAGRHRVFVHPGLSPQESNEAAPDALTNPAFRFSLVHALRAHLPVLVSHTDFETAVTGAYAPAAQFIDTPVLDIYRAISNAHWNVNITVEERRRQERALHERALKGAAGKDDAGAANGSDIKESSGVSLRLSKFKTLFRRKQESVAI
ncbi:hypothetical protein DFH11DRAFT_609189 [Phellopilus nigrolimitatus]|nr:hypothetical protein DFH11DRAFT_609189 [Phellopilus nigrolimitatus]